MTKSSKKKQAARKNVVSAPVVEAPQPAPGWILPACIAVYITLTLLLVIQIPHGSAPDEANHIEYVSYIATNHSLPVFKTWGGNKEPGYEFHQPPLYYAVCALWWNSAGPDTGWLLCRLVSLACGAASLALLWLALRELFPRNLELAALATGFAALWPWHQYVGAAAGNDSLADMFSSAIFYLIARGAVRGWSLRLSLALGVVAGLGILTKTTCVMLAIIGLGALWHTAGDAAETGKLKQRLAFGGSALAAMAVIGGWWLVRNQVLYGDPLALGAFNSRFEDIESGTKHLLGTVPAEYKTYMTYIYARALVQLTFSTLWGVFGGPNNVFNMLQPFYHHPMPPQANPGLLALAVCALATGVALIGIVRWWPQRAELPVAVRHVLNWWTLGLLLVIAAWLQFVAHYFQGQARYFHPALLPLALAFALGWQRALPRRALPIFCAGFGCLLVGVTLWNAFGWRTLA